MEFKKLNKEFQLIYDTELIKEIARDDTRKHIESISNKEKAKKNTIKVLIIGGLTIFLLGFMYLMMKPYLG